MKTKHIVLLITSILLLNIILITSASSFMALYYVIWVLGFGTLVWKYKERVEQLLQKSPFNPAVTFIVLGIAMILLEEAFASFSVNLSPTLTLSAYSVFLLKFWATNLFALPGFIIAWYILLSKFSYTRKEVLILVGLFGLFAEKIYLHVITIPIMGILLILPTMYTYAVIIAPSLLSLPKEKLGQKKLSPISRYVLGFIFPIIISLPFIIVVSILMTKYPQYFYIPN